MCSIKVFNDDIEWKLADVWVRGVAGRQTTGLKVAEGGDSGGLVFANAGGNNRQARGIVSAGNSEVLLWPEAVDILNQ